MSKTKHCPFCKPYNTTKQVVNKVTKKGKKLANAAYLLLLIPVHAVANMW